MPVFLATNTDTVPARDPATGKPGYRNIAFDPAQLNKTNYNRNVHPFPHWPCPQVLDPSAMAEQSPADASMVKCVQAGIVPNGMPYPDGSRRVGDGNTVIVDAFNYTDKAISLTVNMVDMGR